MRPNVRTFGGESPAASFVKFVVATYFYIALPLPLVAIPLAISNTSAK